MVVLVRTLWFSAFAALGAFFFTLAAWETSNGIASGKLGLAPRGDHPGMFWFIIALQLVMAAACFVIAARQMDPEFSARRAIRPALAVVLILGAWAGWESVVMLYGIVMSAAAQERLIYTCLAATAAIVLASALYELVWEELWKRA